MQRTMTTIYLSPDQMKRLRRKVFELKGEVPNLTNSVVIRYGLDCLLSNWEEHKPGIIKAAQQENKRKYQS
jgi:hypothetical protein